MPATRTAGLSLAALAAVLWAVGMAVLQPLTEPIGPWSETLPPIGTYWARDLRFAAIVTIVLGLVLAGRGDRRWTAPAVVLGGLWVAADVAVDRLDLTGAGPTVLLAAAGCAAVAATTLLGVRAQRTAGTDGGARRPEPDRRALVTAACVAGVLAVVAAAITSPTGREPELVPAAVATALLLVASTVGCALAAAPGTGRDRRKDAAAMVGPAVLGVVLVRVVPAEFRILPAVLLSGVLLTGVTLVAWDRPGGRPEWRWHALAVLAALLAPVATGFLALLAMAWWEPVAPLTALAGNTAINADGTDVLYSLAGLLAGLGTALLLAWPPALGGGVRSGPAA